MGYSVFSVRALAVFIKTHPLPNKNYILHVIPILIVRLGFIEHLQLISPLPRKMCAGTVMIMGDGLYSGAFRHFTLVLLDST